MLIYQRVPVCSMVYPLVMTHILLLKLAHSQWIYLFLKYQTVIFHSKYISYVSFPEGIHSEVLLTP